MGIEGPPKEKKSEGSIDDLLGWADSKLNHKEVKDLFKGIGEAAEIGKGVQDLVALVRANPRAEVGVKDHLRWLKNLVSSTKGGHWSDGEIKKYLSEWCKVTGELLAKWKI